MVAKQFPIEWPPLVVKEFKDVEESYRTLRDLTRSIEELRKRIVEISNDHADLIDVVDVITTRGDIVRGDSSGVVERLALGNADEILESDGSDILWVPRPGVVAITDGTDLTFREFTTATQMDWDDSIPQNTEGEEFMTQSHTAKATTNKLKIDAVVNAAASAAGQFQIALFKDSDAAALASGDVRIQNADGNIQAVLTHFMDAGTISAVTYKIRCGMNVSADIVMNGETLGTNARLHGGVMTSGIWITEFRP